MTNPIIVALDLPTADEAMALAGSLVEHVGGFKVGLGVLHGSGPSAIDDLAGLGLPVFADAKLHDIPSQVESAARALGARGARWVTAHISGGAAMLEAAVEGLAQGSGASESGILGVSVLTSLDGDRLAAVGIERTTADLVAAMATAAQDAGCEGIVCSPHELPVVGSVAPNLRRVTPGIRPRDHADDQQRTATPAAAMAAGADWLVIGRPITRAPDPAVAAATIAADIRGARRLQP